MDIKELAGVMEKCMKNLNTYGTGITKYGIRKWYNPLRWVRGPMYVKNVSLEDVYK